MSEFLNASDIVVARRIPGWEPDSYFSACIRVADSGMAACETGFLKDSRTRQSDLQEHHFSDSDLLEIREALALLAVRIFPKVECCDVPIYSLTFRSGDRIIHQKVFSLPYYLPATSSDFRRAWDLIIRPFKDVHPLIGIPLQKKKSS